MTTFVGHNRQVWAVEQQAIAERCLAIEEGRTQLERAIAEAPSRQVRRRLQQKGLR